MNDALMVLLENGCGVALRYSRGGYAQCTVRVRPEIELPPEGMRSDEWQISVDSRPEERGITVYHRTTDKALTLAVASLNLFMPEVPWRER